MIDSKLLKKLAIERLKDADALLAAGRYDGAIYLVGYTVELALKSRICKTLHWPSFPRTSGEFKGYQSFKTHDLDILLSLSGRWNAIKSKWLADWSTVVTWDPEARYNPIGNVGKAEAERMIESAKAILKVL